MRRLGWNRPDDQQVNMERDESAEDSGLVTVGPGGIPAQTRLTYELSNAYSQTPNHNSMPGTVRVNRSVLSADSCYHRRSP